MQKILIIFILTFGSLEAAFFSDAQQVREERTFRAELKDTFRNNVSDANSIIKRGEYHKIETFNRSLERLDATLRGLDSTKVPTAELLADLKAYHALVQTVSSEMEQNAPKLNEYHHRILEQLPTFNKKLASIGLRELLQEWKRLSRIKHRFVKRPNARYIREFEESWTLVYVTITELYLDEEMEQPLFDFLDLYKLYFTRMSEAYRNAGYHNVANIKPLSYKIKMQLELLPFTS